MNHALQLGPLLLPYPVLLVLGAAWLALFAGQRSARRAGVDADGVLWRTLLAAFVAARIAFVLEYRALYFGAPLSILDIRDGGWNPGVGLAAAWLYGLHRQRRTPDIAKPLRAALATGSVVFVIGFAALALRGGTGERLPELAFASIAGERVALSAFAGKPVVINLWATWCPPCVREMPVLQRAQAARTDVHFVFLNQGEDRATVGRWLHARGFDLENVLIDEPRRASAAFRQQGYPTTLFFDAQGRLVGRRVGELSAATLAERLREVAN